MADSIDVVLEVKLGLTGYLYMLVGEADREMSKLRTGPSSGDREKEG